MKTEQRNYAFDFIKAVSTLLIVLHHYQQLHHVHFDSFINFYRGTFDFGYVVELFFVLSGYFVYTYIEPIRQGKTFSSFFTKKYMRFQPLMAITVVVFSLLFVLFRRLYLFDWTDIELSLWGIVSSAIGMQAGWAVLNPGINNPIWYISVLLLCYVIFYWCVFLSNSRGFSKNVFFSFFVLLGIGIQTYNIDLPFMNWASARGFYSFFWGLLLADMIRNNMVTQTLRRFAILILIGFPFLIALNYSFVGDGINYIMTFIYYTAVVVVFASPGAKSIFRSKTWGTIAGISYHVYMWHICVFILASILFFVFNIVPDFSQFGTVVGFILSTYLIGTCSFYIEKRLQNYEK